MTDYYIKGTSGPVRLFPASSGGAADIAILRFSGGVFPDFVHTKVVFDAVAYDPEAKYFAPAGDTTKIVFPVVGKYRITSLIQVELADAYVDFSYFNVGAGVSVGGSVTWRVRESADVQDDHVVTLDELFVVTSAPTWTQLDVFPNITDFVNVGPIRTMIEYLGT